MKKKLMIDEALRLRSENKGLAEISEILGISKGTASLWLRDYPLPESVLKEKKIEAARRMNEQWQPRNVAAPKLVKPKPLRERVYRKGHVPFPDASSVQKGKAAEHLFIAKCLLLGLSCFVPNTENDKIDVIVGPHLARAQVKIINPASRFVAVRKIGVNSKSNTKVYHYTPDDIDVFVAVDLETISVYIIPIADLMRYSSSISLSTLEKNGYKDAFNLVGYTGVA